MGQAGERRRIKNGVERRKVVAPRWLFLGQGGVGKRRFVKRAQCTRRE